MQQRFWRFSSTLIILYLLLWVIGVFSEFFLPELAGGLQ